VVGLIYQDIASERKARGQMISLLIILIMQAIPGSRIEWDQFAQSLNEAHSFTYVYYLDDSDATQLMDVICTGDTSPFICSAPLPYMSNGNHVIQLAARNSIGESPKSDPFGFSFTEGIVPSVPMNIRISGAIPG
jgi:hypothetical protein